jgi:hypothetical protein
MLFLQEKKNDKREVEREPTILLMREIYRLRAENAYLNQLYKASAGLCSHKNRSISV